MIHICPSCIYSLTTLTHTAREVWYSYITKEPTEYFVAKKLNERKSNMVILMNKNKLSTDCYHLTF